MRSPQRLIVLTLAMVAQFTVVNAMQIAEEADSTDNGFTMTLSTVGPSGAMIVGAADSSVASFLQVGVGATWSFSREWHLGVTLKIGVVESAPDLFSSSRTMSPYLNGMLTGVYLAPLPAEWLTVEGIFTLGYGRSTDGFLPNLQTVLGLEIDIPITRNKEGAPWLYAFMVPGYGVDWEQKANRGFCSVGLGFMNWFQLSFDVVSLFDPASSIIHPGRLK